MRALKILFPLTILCFATAAHADPDFAAVDLADLLSSGSPVVTADDFTELELADLLHPRTAARDFVELDLRSLLRQPVCIEVNRDFVELDLSELLEREAICVARARASR